MSDFNLTMKDFEQLRENYWFCQLEYGHVYLDRWEAREWEITIYWKGAKIQQPHRSRKSCIEAIPKLMRAFE